jgi:hypothetical protein
MIVQLSANNATANISKSNKKIKTLRHAHTPARMDDDENYFLFLFYISLELMEGGRKLFSFLIPTYKLPRGMCWYIKRIAK